MEKVITHPDQADSMSMLFADIPRLAYVALRTPPMPEKLLKFNLA